MLASWGQDRVPLLPPPWQAQSVSWLGYAGRMERGPLKRVAMAAGTLYSVIAASLIKVALRFLPIQAASVSSFLLPTLRV